MTRLDGEGADAVRRDIEDYSRIVSDEAQLLRQWEAFLTAYEGYYLDVFNPLNIIPSDYVKTALAKLGIDRLFVTRSHYAQIMNTIRCESHAEAAKGVLERLLK